MVLAATEGFPPTPNTPPVSLGTESVLLLRFYVCPYPQLSSAPVPASPSIRSDLWPLCVTFSLKRSCSKHLSHSSQAQLLRLGPRPAGGWSCGSAHSGGGLFSLPQLPFVEMSGRWAPTSHVGLPFLRRQAGEAPRCSVVLSCKQGWNPPPGPATSHMPFLFA